MRTYCIISIISLLRSALCSTTTFRCFRDKCPSVLLASFFYCWIFHLKALQNCTPGNQKDLSLLFSQGKKKKNQQTSQPPIFQTALFECLMVSNVFIQQVSKGGRCATAILHANWSTDLFFGVEKLITKKSNQKELFYHRILLPFPWNCQHH